MMLASILQCGATGVGAEYREALMLQEGFEEVYDISGAMGDQNQWKWRRLRQRRGLSFAIWHHVRYVASLSGRRSCAV
jgi:hypothetical protein